MFKLFIFCLLVAVAYGAVSTINSNLRAYHTVPVVISGHGGWEGGRGGWDGGRGGWDNGRGGWDGGRGDGGWDGGRGDGGWGWGHGGWN